VAALRRLGLDARVGELAGEYCPGEFSVNLGGRIKVMGVGQRVIRGGAHVGGVITIADTSRLRAVLAPVYAALELELRDETAGGLADIDPALDAEVLVEALFEVLRADGIALSTSRFDPAIEQEAHALHPFHAPETSAGARTLSAALAPPRMTTQPKTLLQIDD